MEPQADPVNLRPNCLRSPMPGARLYGCSGATRQQQAGRNAAERVARGPDWVLDQMGVEVMLANRVSMGPTIQPPRFRWVPYADALIFPLDNSKLAAVNSDRKSFFALEDNLRARYLQDAGLSAPPATRPRPSFKRGHAQLLGKDSSGRVAPSPRSSRPHTCARWRSTKWTAPPLSGFIPPVPLQASPPDYKALQD